MASTVELYATPFNVPVCISIYGPFFCTPETMSALTKLQLHTIFNKLDKNGDGLVSLDELMWLLDNVGVCVTRDELELLVGKHALDPLGFILFYETLIINGAFNDDASREENGEVLENDLRKAFRVFDLNGDGFISCDELQAALSKLGLWDEHSGRDCKSMIGEYDVNKDGLLDFEEFKSMMSV